MTHGEQEWLSERLLERRKIALSGVLDSAAAARVAAALAHLETTGDGAVTLWLSNLSADLDAAFPLVDTLEGIRAPVHATCVGTLTGAAVAVLAVADRRTAGRNALLHLCDPAPATVGPGGDLPAYAHQHSRRLRRLHECVASACRHDVGTVARDMRAGRLLDADQARAHGLIDHWSEAVTRHDLRFDRVDGGWFCAVTSDVRRGEPCVRAW